MSREKQHSKAEILTKTVPLFAEAGYAGVSMRQIAQVVGIKASSIYHHFPDKQTLYIEALALAFSSHADFLNEVFILPVSPEERLRHLIEKLCVLASEDETFRRLTQRELLDGDEQRLQLLASYVFGDFFSDLNKLCEALAPGYDPHLLSVSFLGLVLYHFQIMPIRSFLPGYKTSQDNPEILAEHIVKLLKNGCR